jgi:hypothetical protein
MAKAVRGFEQGLEPRLRVPTPGGLVTANDALDIPRRALSFLVAAIREGAEPAAMRHTTGAFLAHHGFPWLWAPYKLADEYRRALVACRRHGEGNLMARVMMHSIAKFE